MRLPPHITHMPIRLDAHTVRTASSLFFVMRDKHHPLPYPAILQKVNATKDLISAPTQKEAAL